MQVVRYQTTTGVSVGVLRTDGSLCPMPAPSLSHLLCMTAADFRATVECAVQREESDYRILPPVDGYTEVWAAGVTYLRSRVARVEESTVANVYDMVYNAERPELFKRQTCAGQ